MVYFIIGCFESELGSQITMKVIIVILCIIFVSSIAAQTIKTTTVGSVAPKGDLRPPNFPGCAKPPKGTKLSDCCTNFPKFFSKEVMNNNCSSTCGKEKKAVQMCCVSECSLNAFSILVNGTFNVANAKSAISKMAAKNTAFTPELIGKIVDQCVSAAPSKLQYWRSKAPADMAPTCSNNTSLNIVISGCIRRELFFQCPVMKNTTNCAALVNFGKGCAFFPFHDGPIGGGRRPDGDDSDVKKPEITKPTESQPVDARGPIGAISNKPTGKPTLPKATEPKKSVGNSTAIRKS